MIDTYSKNGVIANPVSMKEGNNLSITYQGLLFESGADDVFAHYGYGSRWTKQNTVKMMKTENGFKANIPIHKTGPINIAFKDSAWNWDNNDGTNYSFKVRSK